MCNGFLTRGHNHYFFSLNFSKSSHTTYLITYFCCWQKTLKGKQEHSFKKICQKIFEEFSNKAKSPNFVICQISSWQNFVFFPCKYLFLPTLQILTFSRGVVWLDLEPNNTKRCSFYEYFFCIWHILSFPNLFLTQNYLYCIYCTRQNIQDVAVSLKLI